MEISVFHKNFLLTGENVDPTNLDYDIFGLYKKRTLVKGELVIVEYYKGFDGASHSGLTIKEDRTYTRANGFVAKRDMDIFWYFEDGETGITKHTEKYYTITEAITEGVIRRSNIIDEAKVCGLAMITGNTESGIPNSYDFLIAAETAGVLRLYEQGITTPLIDWISGSTKEYLTVDAKQAMVNVLLI